MKPKTNLVHWPKNTYIPAASHDADSTKFRERQQQRIREMQKSNVKPLKRTA